MGLVAVLGAGVMGETLLSGLLRAGRHAGELVVAGGEIDDDEENEELEPDEDPEDLD